MIPITFGEIISLENLLLAWKEFRVGKKSRRDVMEFEQYLMRNVISLHHDLITKKYKHGEYEAFNISDPKPRNIHKASVRDRLLHHAVYRMLYPFFDRLFIADSYSCRVNKGTHNALQRFQHFSVRVSKNNTQRAWVLKCDVRKFFASIDQGVLMEILVRDISDGDVQVLLREIVSSFHSTSLDMGLPLGNLTSQLLVNIYMNEFDQYMKHVVHAEYYIRYADDFVIFSDNRRWLDTLLFRIQDFLYNRLHLQLHPDKVFIQTLASGVDFLGWVHFPHHRVLRTVTKRRMWKNINIQNGKRETVQSYLGLLGYGNTAKLMQIIKFVECVK